MRFLDIRRIAVAASIVSLAIGSQPIHSVDVTAAEAAAADTLSQDWKAAISLLEAGDREALSALASLFARATERPLKERVAFQLVLLGVQDAEYFDYLAEQAQKAVDSAIPSPFAVDDKGFPVGTAPSAGFVAWCEEHGIEPEQAYLETQPPRAFILLSYSGDPRAFDLFMRGLQSQHISTAMGAANGLGHIGDERAVPAIVAALEGASLEKALVFARALVLFESTEAHRVARSVLEGPRLRKWREERLGKEAATSSLYEAAVREAEFTKSAFEKERHPFGEE